MGRVLRNNGLSIVMFGLFFAFVAAQSVAGYLNYQQDQQEHQAPAGGYLGYLGSGDFIEAVFENWESEFLQMGAYVLLTAFLFQQGSAESRDPDEQGEEADDPDTARWRANLPGPVRHGGVALKLYEHSLALALFALFLFSFALHAIGGARRYSEEQLQHGEPAVSALHYLGTSRFWFESFQNWQSEFLAVGMLVILSIVLRQRDSPESKRVEAAHRQTGSQQ
ncbi:MAG: hypothetical protein M3Q65_19190 [Chloroflexota bacterium]|nr:hypothetical protein [Chloroflexota bacterium]